MNSNLNERRRAIDAIDRSIIELIGKRIDLARRIGRAKAGDGFLRDSNRELEIYSRWAETAREHRLSGYFLGRILREILNYSRRVQEGFLEGNAVRASQTVSRVGYKGVVNSYSHLALHKLFAARENGDLEPVGYHSFEQALSALHNGEVQYLFLPIENTIAGSLNEVYRLLTEQRVTIVDEEIWQVQHCLAALPDTAMKDIRTVRSHPLALEQCRGFLERTPSVSAEPHFNTAAAAESVVSEKDPSIAVICSEECAQNLGLNILRRDIADHPDNFTRFILVSHEPEKVDRRQPCKTSLQFAVSHRGGALADVLRSFANRNINLTKLESRPQPQAPWEYLFYLDAEGHQDDPLLAEALEEIEQHTRHLRILGSYPRRSHEVEPVRTDEATSEARP